MSWIYNNGKQKTDKGLDCIPHVTLLSELIKRQNIPKSNNWVKGGFSMANWLICQGLQNFRLCYFNSHFPMLQGGSRWFCCILCYAKYLRMARVGRHLGHLLQSNHAVQDPKEPIRTTVTHGNAHYMCWGATYYKRHLNAPCWQLSTK